MNKFNNMKNRQRGRNGGKPRPPGGGQNRNFDGGMRPRGNAQQLMEKFLALARDASSMGDRVAAENYYQHADHYYRVLNARFEAQQQHQQQHGYNNGQRRPDQSRYDRFPGEGEEQGGEGQNFNRGYDQRPQGQGYQGQDQRPDQRQDYRNDRNEPRQEYDRGGFTDNSYSGESRPEPQDNPGQASYAPQPAPARGPIDSDIGLPPQVLGLSEAGGDDQQRGDVNGQGEGQGEARPPRRRRGRGHGPRPPGAENPARD